MEYCSNAYCQKVILLPLLHKNLMRYFLIYSIIQQKSLSNQLIAIDKSPSNKFAENEGILEKTDDIVAGK